MLKLKDAPARHETILDRLWLWGMRVNALQNYPEWAHLGWPESRITVEQAIRDLKIANIYIAGGLEIEEATLKAIPSARQFICKWQLHEMVDKKQVMRFEACAQRLEAANRLALKDARIRGFLVDDFSTGSMDAGVTVDHLARLREISNIPLMGTAYTLSLNRSGLSEMLSYFDQLMVPLWDASEIDTFPDSIHRCADLSGGKPMSACLYFFDFGKNQMIDRKLMQRQLDVVEPLLRSGKVAGLILLGTCMLDLGWESVRCAYDWIANIGGDSLSL